MLPVLEVETIVGTPFLDGKLFDDLQWPPLKSGDVRAERVGDDT